MAKDPEDNQDTNSTMAIPTCQLFLELFDELEAIKADYRAMGLHLNTDEVLWLPTQKNKDNDNGPHTETR